MRSTLILLASCLFAALLPSRAADSPVSPRRARIIFSIRVQDWVHYSESADTAMRLIGIFDRHKVRADILLAGPVVEKYALARPEILHALRESGMSIGYLILPPHPACSGFDRELAALGDPEMAVTLANVERFGIDPATGAIVSKRPGNFALVASIFERAPTVAWPASRGRIHSSLCDIYENMGTRMIIMKTDALRKASGAFVFCGRMLVRPDDIRIDQWRAKGESQETAWWNRAGDPSFNPVERITTLLSQWKGERAPNIVCELEENFFARRGPVAWTSYYYDEKGRPLKPPYDLTAPDPSAPRPKEEQEAIWRAFEALVAHAGKHFEVVTSDDLLNSATSNGFIPAPAEMPILLRQPGQ